MKKKILVLSLVVALLATAIVSGSLAWFTDSDEATNVFTVGSIEIIQHEKNADGTDFTQDQPMLPIVNIADPAADPNYIAKVVTVENEGKNAAYVRTHIAVPTQLLDYLHLDVKLDNWTSEYTTYIAVDNVPYTVFTYRYNDALAPNKTTEVLLQGVYMDARVDVQKNPASNNMEFCMPDGNGGFTFSGYAVTDAEGTDYKVNVLVATQAVQQEGFADAETALSNAFGSTVPFGA